MPLASTGLEEQITRDLEAVEAGISDGSDGTDDDIPNWRELFAEECARTRLYAGLDPPAQDDKALQEQDKGSAMLPQVSLSANCFECAESLCTPSS